MIRILARWLIGDAANELEGLRFAFNVPFDQTIAWALLAIAGLGVALVFWRRLANLQRFARALLVGLRAAAVALILFLLLDPCLTGKRVRRTDRAVLLLFDDSKSMQVVGPDGRTRGQSLTAAWDAAQSDLEKRLRDRCQLVFCRFGGSVERVRSPRDLAFEQNDSDLIGAVERALADFEGADVAAVALFSDGAQQTRDRPADAQALERLGVPVIAVGVGADSQWRDVEVGPLAAKRADVDRSPVTIKAPVRASGLSGEEVIVEALADGAVVQSSRLKVAGDPAEMEARLEFVPAKKGWQEYEVRARLAGQSDNAATSSVERIAQNNSRRFIVDNRDKTYRILYLGGRPNWENKFIRRAMEDDGQLKLTSLIRISGPEKTFKYRGGRSSLANPIFEGTDTAQDAPRYDEAVFIRLGAASSDLPQGYPDHAEELFPFQLVVWGEIEANFFSQAQLELTRDYVRKRGGGLLLLGGPHSFSEGGFGGTIIESMLPTRLGEPGQAGAPAGLLPDKPFLAQPTLDGLLAGAWALDPSPQENQRLWNEMPALFGINTFAFTRPGAAIHANAVGKESERDSRPLFAAQRYGEGRCAVLATGSTWQWRLGADEQDRRHERLWRQIVRSLVRQAPEGVQLRARQDAYTLGESAGLEFMVRDAVFDEREGLSVAVTAAAPSGRETALPVEESIQEAGLYSSEYTPQEPGMHKLSLKALDDQGKAIGTLEQAVLVEPDQREFHQAQYNPSLLREIARRSGGEFLPLEKIAEIPNLIRWRPSEQAEEARIHLWRFAGFYYLLAMLLIAEWYLRRKKGHR